MPTDQKPHVLTVTCADADEHGHCDCAENDDPHSLDIRVTCPGTSDVCRTYWECIECNAADEDSQELLMETSEAHGVEHRYLDCGWSVPSDDCWVQHAGDGDEVRDAFRDLFAGRAPLGTFLVAVDDGDPLTLALVALAEADRD